MWSNLSTHITRGIVYRIIWNTYLVNIGYSSATWPPGKKKGNVPRINKEKSRYSECNLPPITKIKSLMRRISHQWAGGKVHSLDIGSWHDWTACLTLVWQLEWTNQCNYIGENKKSNSCLATHENSDHSSGDRRLLCHTIQPGSCLTEYSAEVKCDAVFCRILSIQHKK